MGKIKEMLKSLLVVSFFAGIIGFNSPFMDELRRIYERQGLPFREERFLENQPILQEYDFIVVGSGPAGSAVTRRLTEIPEWKVLLLEAGIEGTVYNDLPSVSPFFILTNYSWGYKAEHQNKVCLGLEDGLCLWPSGKGVGGGTIMNGMIMTRGHPTDYDRWGQEGWSYKDVLPYFLRSERMTIPSLRNSSFHSTEGPINIEYPFPSSLINRFLKAGKEFGYRIVDYNNGRTPEGFSKTQTSIRKGRRHSAATAYLFPIKSAPNFHIAKKALVTRVLIDPKTNRAHGVVFIKNGIERVVFARKEIILSAGAFNTPQLLMLSGIGPRDHLKELNIPLIKDLPVGDNLQEHLTTIGASFLINTTDSYTLRKMIFNSLPYFYKWYNYGTSPYANNGAEGLAYIRTNPNLSKPDVEFIFMPITIASDDGIILRRTMGITDETYYPPFSKIGYAEGFSIWPMGMYPESRGKVRLRSVDPRDPPILFANFLTHPADSKVIVEGIKAAIRLSKTTAFQEIGATLYTAPIPGCEDLRFGTNPYWECVLRTIPVQLHHQCCTARMGRSPADSVIDNRLRVHGVKGLRVADASVMPTITGAHTMAPCYMIGEKAGDLIKEDWGKF
ncbi:glucose dehydrogenase [FAD, quinone]-like [Cimex lectularius]|uniref:Glucose-methanol-choline oxidoreductase N-terminal domain-containing protein n=1 Tax=Cimex lectularius TaxID=79782 RepID=A0A8I6S142_CIMLE|nr:glucose dehydrogenase [FAD, quinone]-like [Cimex lectularius]